MTAGTELVGAVTVDVERATEGVAFGGGVRFAVVTVTMLAGGVGSADALAGGAVLDGSATTAVDDGTVAGGEGERAIITIAAPPIAVHATAKSTSPRREGFGRGTLSAMTVGASPR